MKVKRFDVSPEFLKMILSGERIDFEAQKKYLPSDSELVRIFVDEKQSSPNIISFIFHSNEFPDLPEGSSIERETVLFGKYHKK